MHLVLSCFLSSIFFCALICSFVFVKWCVSIILRNMCTNLKYGGYASSITNVKTWKVQNLVTSIKNKHTFNLTSSGLQGKVVWLAAEIDYFCDTCIVHKRFWLESVGIFQRNYNNYVFKFNKYRNYYTIRVT